MAKEDLDGIRYGLLLFILKSEFVPDTPRFQLGKSVDHSRPSSKLLDCSRSSFGRHHTSRPNVVRLLITAGLQ
jgi:hypothetical protein